VITAALVPTPTPPDPAILAQTTYPLERCAAIAGSLARRKVDKTAILREHDLTPEVWAELDSHWRDAVRLETERGSMALLRAYDGAYIDQIEAERGPVTVDQYVQVAMALENGIGPNTLQELDLPRSALLPVQRVWMEKLSQNKELAERVRQAIDHATSG
jgi:hypothetical protein